MKPRQAVRAIREELVHLRPRLLIALALGRWIPELVGSRLRASLLRLAGVNLGKGTVIGGGIHIAGTGSVPRALTVGARCWINRGCYFDVSAPVVIGNDVAFGQDVLVITQTHQLGPAHRRAGRRRTAAVAIGDGCWLGARSVILPGVTIGCGAVVAAGAVVRTSVSAHTLVAGVPAREVRQLELDSLSSDDSRGVAARRNGLPSGTMTGHDSSAGRGGCGS